MEEMESSPKYRSVRNARAFSTLALAASRVRLWKNRVQGAYTRPRRDGKSAEAFEKKRTKGAPSLKRVRKGVKTKEFIGWGFLAEFVIEVPPCFL